jgi:phosphatidylglycerophosphatase A
MIDKSLLLRDARGWIASGFGSGLAPFAPGTFGTLAAIPFVCLLGYYCPLWLYLLVTTLVFALGCWAAGWVIRTFKVEDPGVVVIDEWVGFALSWAPVAYWSKPMPWLTYLVCAFLVFRAADILKPWPASWADQKLHGGFGAMLDDAFAGIWAALVMVVLLWQDVLVWQNV